MQINELRLNLQFNYIKDIRRYMYDFEEFLRKSGFCEQTLPVPPIPDDIEPFIERFHCIKTEDYKQIHISISQISCSLVFSYTKAVEIDKVYSNDFDYIKQISNSIKEFFKENIKTYTLNYEGVVLINILNIDKEKKDLIAKYSIDTSKDEDRTRISYELNDKYFFIKEKSIQKSYNLLSQTINPFAIKNKYNNFMGWTIVLYLEINNRLEFNNSEDDFISKLNYDEAKKVLSEKLTEEL